MSPKRRRRAGGGGGGFTVDVVVGDSVGVGVVAARAA